MTLRLEFVDENLKSCFSKLGFQIGQRPGYFIIVPLLLTALSATGFQRIFFQADPEFLFSPSNGEAKYERAVLEANFPFNYSDFEPGRVSRGGRFGKLIVTAKDGGSLFRSRIWNQILFLDEIARNVTIAESDDDDDNDVGNNYKDDTNGKNANAVYGFEDLCASYNGRCWYNEILGITAHMKEIESGELRVTYPIWLDPFTFERYTFPFFLGGIRLGEDSTIENVTALSLFYFLNTGTKQDEIRGARWEGAFLATIKEQSFPDIEVVRFSSLTLEVELENNTNSVIPFFALNIGIMITFCIITCMMTDWVKSKPVLGLLGVISAILGTIVSFGLVIYCGMPFIGINLAAPFLMLGIGIDDTFVMLGAWRRTSVHDSVPERMANSYKDAAVSITITSVTDMLSFWIGIITPFPCVQIFCVYTGACVAFTYLWHITFFGGCMAVAGYAEKSNRHSITCLKVTAKSKSGHRNWLYRIFCSGGISSEDPFNKKDNAENAIMIFFRDYVAAALNNAWFKILILIIFSFYLATSAWGISNLKQGLERRKLARFDSYSIAFYDREDTYFREYPYRVNVVLSGRLDYSDPQVQEDIENLLQKFENTTFIDGTYTESWFRDFLDYVKRNKDYVPIDVSNEESFIDSLNKIYLESGQTHYTKDVRFSPDNKSIIASRFLIQGSRIYDANDEKDFVEELRQVCHASKYNVTVFHPLFIYFDQFLIVFPTTIQCVTVAAIVMMIISLIFIPNPICSLWVAFSIISIELGVVGFMTLWGVSLDSISMVNLIMCIGFSVDFSAHISYHYMSRDPSMSTKERVVDSMFALGLPISQGAISTILGVVGLALAPSYVFITFFKMVFLVIVLGALHGLLLLPILLSVFGPGACRKDKSTNISSGSSSSSSRSTAGSGSGSSNNNSNTHLHHQHQDLQIKIPRPSTTKLPKGTRTNRVESRRTQDVVVPRYIKRITDDDAVIVVPKKKKNTTTSSSSLSSKSDVRLREMYTNSGYESEDYFRNSQALRNGHRL